MTDSIPKGFHSVTPFLMVDNVEELITFMENGLGATKVSALHQISGKIMHAQMKIGDSMLLVGDSMGKPTMPQSLYIYLDDTDSAHLRALEAGAVNIKMPEDQFYGDRNAGVQDKFGNMWWLATHIEDISDEDLQERAIEFEKNLAECQTSKSA